MSLINLNQTIPNLNGDLINDSKGKPYTVKTVLIGALLFNHPKEDINGDEKSERFILATRISNTIPVDEDNNPFELKSEEIVKLKHLIGNMYSTMLVGRMYEILK